MSTTVGRLEQLQERLPHAYAANRHGSTTPHVVIMLPSYNVSAALLEHYGHRLGPLEHRYLLAMLMLGRIPGAEALFVTSDRPSDSVVDYYLGLLPADRRAEAASRFSVVEVPRQSTGSVAAELLRRPDLLEGMRQRIAGRPALIEPWSVTDDEAALALELGAPFVGTLPHLWPLGYKSSGRKVFRAAAVPTPYGIEDVHTVADVAEAIDAVLRARPDAAGVVVKLDDSVAGDGNVIVRRGSDVGAALAALPDWYVADLAAGGVVEELVTGERFTSPSVQVDLEPTGEVVVRATHEQVLGGDNGQVFLGCRFPAEPAYAARLGELGAAIGRELVGHGARGRIAVDFAAAGDADGSWRLYALEVNLRKGGTTHPYCVLRHLVPGRYDTAAGRWVDDRGDTACYQCSDNLVDPSWMSLSAPDAMRAVADAGLAFDPESRSGVILHMLNGLRVDGRIGATAIGRTRRQADDLLAGIAPALSAAAR